MIDKYSIESKFGTPVEIINGKNGSLEYRYNCPFCIDNRGDPDTKGHLYVNNKKGVYHCYRCGASGSIKEDKSGYSNVELVDNTEIIKQLSDIVNDTKLSEYSMVVPRKKAYTDQTAREYLNNRGLSDEMIDKYDIRVGGIFSNLLGYVVIPNQVRNLVMTDMYCARSFVGSTPKYRNPSGALAGSSVYNLHRIDQDVDQLIVCEGAFDAISAEIMCSPSVALYGKDCSETKLNKILSKRPKSIVVNLDLDAANKAYELADRIKKRDSSIEVKILLIKEEGLKDASDFLSKGQSSRYRELVNNAQIYNPIISGLIDILGGFSND